MKLVISPDSFKGTMTAAEAARIIDEAVKTAVPKADTVVLPIADGGEGLTDALMTDSTGEKVKVCATKPNGGSITAEYGFIGDGTAIVEMAAASSIIYAPEPKDPMKASSYGTGELIADAAKRAKKILLGLGGSACMDGGMGATAALGVKYLDKDGKEVAPNPLGMAEVCSVSLDGVDPQLFETRFELCADVENELCGEAGAAHVFGPQKGADKDQIKFIDNALCRFAEVLEKYSGKKILGEKGFGAAGGFAMPFYALFNAKLKSGIDLILDALQFDEIIKDADLLVTGEGKIDDQSLGGKAPIGAARRAKKLGVPAIVIAGDVELSLEKAEKEGIRALFSINRRAVKYEEAKLTAKEDLYQTALSVFSFYKSMK